MIFKLFVNNLEVDTLQDEYFEIMKGSVLGSEVGTINREFSTNITLPATERNMSIFKAHKLWGGSSEIFKGVAHFGFEAFECFIQLVEFDDKNIKVFIVKSGEKLTEILEGTFQETIEKTNERKYVYVNEPMNPGDYSSELSVVFADINRRTHYNVSMAENATINLAEMIDKAPIGQYFVKSELNALTSTFYANPNTNLNKQTRALGVWWTVNRRLNVLGENVYTRASGGNSLGNLITEVQEYSQSDYDEGRSLFLYAKIRGVEGVDPNLYSQLRMCLVDIRKPYGEGELIVEDLGDISYPNYREYFYEIKDPKYIGTKLMLGIRSPSSLTINVDCELGYSVKDGFYKPPGQYELHPFYLPHSGTTLKNTVVKNLLKSLAVENGKYLNIGRDDKVHFVDIPTLDDLTSTNMELYFNRFLSSSLERNSPLKAVNNKIKYPEDVDGSFSYINIKIDDNRKYAPLEYENTIYELSHYRGGTSLFPKVKGDLPVFTGSTTILSNSLGKYRIYRDTFNNIILFQIEFKNLREIPEGIMYIPQLNGLFMAEKIIKTSKETIIVNCYKITKQ